MSKPLVALVGRPNVGKSTLFNRLVGSRSAIVADTPGTTRDRLYGELEWRGRELAVIDTGGLLSGSAEEVAESVFAQAETAMEEADVIVFIVDGRTGLTPIDKEIADRLRQSKKRVLVAVNKIDNVRQESQSLEFHSLALEKLIPISAERGLNTGDLLDEIAELLPAPEQQPEESEIARIAIVGRPNVGKSSLLNALVGQSRAIVAEEPGTTRDAVDTEIEFKGERVVLVDTAGIRRRGKIIPGIERYSVLRAVRAIDRADVAVLVIDATEPIAAQDAHVAGFVHEKAKGLVVAVNKWDLVEKEGSTAGDYEKAIRRELRFMPYIPILFISSKTGQRIEQVLDEALSIRKERQKRIPTGALNQAARQLLSHYPPPSSGGKALKVFYLTQVAVNPPTFVIKVNEPELVHFGYRRFLENRLRDKFGFAGTPIRLHFRPRGREAA